MKRNKKQLNLKGDLPNSSYALLLIDVMNDLEFPGGRSLERQAKKLASKIAALARRARQAGVPVIYVNDNFKQWRSSFEKLVEHCSQAKRKGCALAQALKPEEKDYFILKPEKSAFYQTPLAILLEQLQVKKLILAGLTTDSCIYLSACEAHMRDYKIFVPQDCVAAIQRKDHRIFLNYMKKNLQADVRPSSKIRF